MSDGTTTSLQAIGLSAAFIQAGFSFGVSWMVLPKAYDLPPSSSLPLFKYIFNSGGLFVVPFGGITALVTGAAAYRDPEQRVPLSIATAIAVAPMIYTRLYMFPGIQTLLSYEAGSAEKASADAGRIVKLLQGWTAQNYVRAGMSFTAGALGLYLLLQKFHGKQKRL
ncbi:hypothetical protein BDZ85DRAFT_267787 [Elsinoe ampelina]|uniref:DUF1772-domain-containing protein n=1 Tax=Elsinoe ampelina TaxID=302913 RepID=A0A6A6G2F8_9PEZI|nr:hypothetical protein BDZ85DRAFT_267787 [Elsinoe ampelina]